MGSKSGVGVRIHELEKRTNVVHCQAHGLNLVVQDFASRVSLLNTFMSNNMLNFVRASPRRLAELANIAVEFDIDQSLRPLCSRRWTLRYSAFQTLKAVYPAVIQELELIACNGERAARAKPAGWHNHLQGFQFCIILVIALELFNITDKLSQTLENQTVSAMDGKHASDMTVTTIHAWHNNDHFMMSGRRLTI